MPEKKLIQVGDPDDHDIAKLWNPSRLGCVTWALIELAAGVVGTILLNNNLPAGDQLSKHAVELLAAWVAVPTVYFTGITAWLFHFDLDHYERTTDHKHHLTSALKTPLVAASKVLRLIRQ